MRYSPPSIETIVLLDVEQLMEARSGTGRREARTPAHRPTSIFVMGASFTTARYFGVGFEPGGDGSVVLELVEDALEVATAITRTLEPTSSNGAIAHRYHEGDDASQEARI